MNRWVTLIGLIVTLASFVGTLYPPTHTVAIIAGLVGAVAAAVGRALWPDQFPQPPEPPRK